MAEVIAASDRVMCITEPLYCYVYNGKSATAQLSKQKSGILIYQSILGAGNLVIGFMKNVKNRSNQLSDCIQEGIPWFVNRLFMRLVKTTSSQRSVFYQCLSEDANNGQKHREICSYMDFKNRFIVKYPTIGQLALDVLSKVYNWTHK